MFRRCLLCATENCWFTVHRLLVLVWYCETSVKLLQRRWSLTRISGTKEIITPWLTVTICFHEYPCFCNGRYIRYDFLRQYQVHNRGRFINLEKVVETKRLTIILQLGAWSSIPSLFLTKSTIDCISCHYVDGYDASGKESRSVFLIRSVVREPLVAI